MRIKMRIKKGDKVLVISGKDRGRTGKVIKALPKERRVVIEGVNLIKKHIRTRRQGQKGQIIQLPAPLDVSNVKLLCPKCNKTKNLQKMQISYMNLQEYYKKNVIAQMKEKFGYKSPMAVPVLEKVVVNAGFGKLVAQSKDKEDKIIEQIVKDLAIITGQKPVLTKAKKSISGFKLRQGKIIGAKVTLRKKRMYEFLSRLINIALPRQRDFQGIDLKSIDQRGNLTLGIKESTVFPEVVLEKSPMTFGLEIAINVKAKNRQEAIELYSLMGFPLKIKNH